MSQMLSYVVHKTGKLYWISPDQRREIWQKIKEKDKVVGMKWCFSEELSYLDSHNYISKHYEIREDDCTKLEVNPFNRQIRIDTEKFDIQTRYVDSSFKQFAKILDKMTWEDIQICHLCYAGFEPHEKYKKAFEENRGKPLILVPRLAYTKYDLSDTDKTQKMIENVLNIKLPKKGDLFTFENCSKSKIYEFQDFVCCGMSKPYLVFWGLSETPELEKESKIDEYSLNLNTFLFYKNEYTGKIPEKPVYVKSRSRDFKSGDLVMWRGTKTYHPSTVYDACRSMTPNCIRQIYSIGIDSVTKEQVLHVYTQINRFGTFDSSYRFSPNDFDKVRIKKVKEEEQKTLI